MFLTSFLRAQIRLRVLVNDTRFYQAPLADLLRSLKERSTSDCARFHTLRRQKPPLLSRRKADRIRRRNAAAIRAPRARRSTWLQASNSSLRPQRESFLDSVLSQVFLTILESLAQNC